MCSFPTKVFTFIKRERSEVKVSRRVLDPRINMQMREGVNESHEEKGTILINQKLTRHSPAYCMG